MIVVGWGGSNAFLIFLWIRLLVFLFECFNTCHFGVSLWFVVRWDPRLQFEGCTLKSSHLNVSSIIFLVIENYLWTVNELLYLTTEA